MRWGEEEDLRAVPEELVFVIWVVGRSIAGRGVKEDSAHIDVKPPMPACVEN